METVFHKEIATHGYLYFDTISTMVTAISDGQISIFMAPNRNQLRKATAYKLNPKELANPQESSLEEEEHNTSLVKDLYEALSSRDVDTVQRLLAPDIEWWFHGPPCHQHLMRILTGAASPEVSFDFEPLSIVAFGSTVLVEGYDKSRSVSWVQAWTIADGIITQVREYFNTSVTVTRFGNSKVTSAPSVNCQSIWESKFSDNPSMPGLVLAL